MEGKKAVIAGGRRIIQKKKNSINVVSRKSNYSKNIQACNEKILSMNDNDYLKFRDYSTKIIDEVCNDIKRNHFKDRDEFRKFKEGKLKYIYSTLFYPKNEIKIIFKSDNHTFIEKTFSKDGLVIIDKIISLLENTIKERKYEPIDEESIYDEKTFKSNCEILGVNSNEKILFSTIKNAYNTCKEQAGGNDEQKDKVNKAYIAIRNQYEDYLKTVL